MINGIKEQMLALLESKGEVSAAEFRALMPGVPEQTVFSRIRSLERSGLLYQSGRGKYSLGTKPVYKEEIFPKMMELSSALTLEFVGATLCISSLDKSNILIETDRVEVDRMLIFLRERYKGVYSLREAIRNREFLKDAIIVKPIITDAPLILAEGLTAPSLEKKLVDLIADRAFFHFEDSDLKREFQRAFEVYPININRLLRYAGRRNVAKKVKAQIASLNSERLDAVSMIQRTLAGLPVLRAWLFGSWSRMEERENSDIDLLVDFDKSAGVSLLDHVGYQQELESLLNRPVDLVTNGTLFPHVAKNVNNDKYLIYERRA